ncbi:MAG: methyltransferase domain-containing protein [Bacteroidetes bacterium]|nr:MAG: methyltransferase domain-containing protein [Bacteroidota bacterium]
MALAQHVSLDIRFQQQYDNARTYLLPFIEEVQPLQAGMQVMEIGCGEGGVLKAFTDRGMHCLGVDLNASRIQSAQQFMQPEREAGLARFIAQNVYEEDFRLAHQAAFDLILLKDTIEHIPQQETFIPYLIQFLKPGGHLFFGFPPWYMPFGGHQQICRSRFISLLPYYHLLPAPLYKGILKLFGEEEKVIQELMEIKATGISLERFERIVKHSGLKIDKKTLFLINPIYEYKFGLKGRKQLPLLAAIPWLRNFLTTAGWYLLSVDTAAAQSRC